MAFCLKTHLLSVCHLLQNKIKGTYFSICWKVIRWPVPSQNDLKYYILKSPFLTSCICIYGLIDMQMKCRSVIEVRDGLTFLDLIVIQIEVILESFFYLVFISPPPHLCGLSADEFIQHLWCRISIPNTEAMFLCFWWIHSTLMMTLKRYSLFISYLSPLPSRIIIWICL